MPLREAIWLALGQIRAQKLKSVFSLIGVTIGVMFLIAVVSIVEGLGRYMEEEFAAKVLGVNTFTLRRIPWFSGGHMTREEWARMQRRPRIEMTDVDAIRAVLPAGTRYAVDHQEQLTVSTAEGRPLQVETHAVHGDYFAIKRYDLQRGRVFAAQEMERGVPVAVIGDAVATRFFPNLDPLGREIRMGGIPYRVVGVLEKQGSFFGSSLDRLVIAPYRSPLYRLINPRGGLNGVMVQSATSLGLTEAMENVRELMRARHRLRPSQGDDFVMETSASAMQEFEEVKGVMRGVGTALPGIGLFVGGLVIMNIMLVAVAERTREIGIRKALGARRRDILRQFLVEAAVLSTLGALLGIALGIALSQGIAWKFPLPATVAPWSIVVATLLGTVVGIVSGVYPARRAARLDPIAALRQE